MTTHVLRHGRTSYSKRYLVNGDPTKRIYLDEVGRQSLRRTRSNLAHHFVPTWLTSEFPRAWQTASLLRGASPGGLMVDTRMNELDYGEFEGRPFSEYASWLDSHGPRQRPRGATESQHEGIRRMLTGVLAVLECPGPRVLVAHGLLLSVLRWHYDHTPGERLPLFFPEAPYAEAIAIADDELPDLIYSLSDNLGSSNDPGAIDSGEAVRLPIGPWPGVATFASVSPTHSPDKKDLPHA